jgi:transcriptional regulator with XRE-family HTH domain
MTGADFKALRERFGLTRSALAEALEIDRKTAQRYESGERPIPRHIALACRALEALAALSDG